MLLSEGVGVLGGEFEGVGELVGSGPSLISNSTDPPPVCVLKQPDGPVDTPPMKPRYSAVAPRGMLQGK